MLISVIGFTAKKKNLPTHSSGFYRVQLSTIKALKPDSPANRLLIKDTLIVFTCCSSINTNILYVLMLGGKGVKLLLLYLEDSAKVMDVSVNVPLLA